MSESKHTPGDWMGREDIRGGIAVVSERGTLAVVCQPEGMPFEECEANARLIAAAPDLLAALQAWQEIHESNGDDGKDSVDWIARVEARMRMAIRKATT